MHRSFLFGAQFLTVIMIAVQAVMDSSVLAQSSITATGTNKTDLSQSAVKIPISQKLAHPQPRMSQHHSVNPTENSFNTMDCNVMPAGSACEIIDPGRHLRYTSTVSGFNGPYNFDFAVYILPTDVDLPVSWRAVISHSESGSFSANAIHDHLDFFATTGLSYYAQEFATTSAGTFVSYSNKVIEWEGTAHVVHPDRRFFWHFRKDPDWPTNDVWNIQIDFYYGSLPSLIDENAVLNTCELECEESAAASSQGFVGRPINTRTGGLFYQTDDLSIPTSAGTIDFQRTYSTRAVSLYSASLGYGWTHSLDSRLIFPTDPGGEAGSVFFKIQTANLYRFRDNGNGTYTPAPGVTGTLTASGGQYSLTLPGQDAYQFDSTGKTLSRTDAQGHVRTYTYDTNDRLERVSADGGTRYLALAYDSQGRIVSVSDHGGREVEFTYSTAGDLASVTDVVQGTWSYEYDNAHHLTRVIDPLSQTTERNEYDSQGRAIRQYDGLNNLIVELTYNADGTTNITDALGNQTAHTYDERRTLTGNTDSLENTIGTTYDRNFRPTAITNAAGHTLSTTWSADGVRLLSKIDPAGNQTDNTYDALNNLISVTDPRGFLTTYTYDGKLLTSSVDALNNETTYIYTPEGYLESVTDALGREISYTYDSHGQRLSMTNPDGNTWTYTYDSLGRLTDTTDPRGRVSHSEYNAAGQLTRSVQNYTPSRSQNDEGLYNIVTEYEYNPLGHQTGVTDTLGRVTEYEYDAAGRLIHTTDPAGNVTTNTYDAAGRLGSTTDALGRVTTYQYDATGRLIQTTNALDIESSLTTFDVVTYTSTVTDIAPHSTTFYYDELNRVIKVVDALGNETLTSYDENGNLETRTDPLGRVTAYEYDALNRLIGTTDPNGGVTETFYDEGGGRIATVDALGKTTTYTYDDTGRLIATTDPLGRVTRTEYDQYGRRSASVDAAGGRTTYTYDLLDRVIAVTDPAGNTTHTIYDALGNVVSQVDANGHETTTVYDILNRVLSVTDANGNTTTNEYDEVGNLLSVTDALGNITSYEYDALNRRITTTDPLENATHTYYDSLGNVSSTVDANGVVTRFEYDALNRQVAVVLNYKPGVQSDAETNVRYEFTYNEVGNRTEVEDPNGHTTSYGYDALNRLLEKVDPLENTWTYEYDLAGRRISATDAESQTTLYTYDDAGQLTGVDYPGTGMDVTYTYDLNGQRLTMTDGLGTTIWSYDALQRPTDITDPFGAAVSYDYDAAGNRTGLTYPDDKSVEYEYDDVNGLTSVTDWNSQVTTYSYDDTGRVVAVERPNGVESAYLYDDAGRLTGLQHNQASDMLAAYTYSYDAAGNRVQAVENLIQPVPLTPTPTLTATDTLTPTSTATNTPTPTATPADSSLVGYWSFNEGTGVAVNDSSSYANHGTVNGAAWTTGESGSGLSFDGSNDRVQIPGSTSLSLNTNRATFAAWVNADTLDGDWTTVIQRSNTAGSWYDWQMYARAADAPTAYHPVCRISLGGGWSDFQVQGDIVLQPHTWYHLACTYDGTALKFYINGTLRGTTNYSNVTIRNSGKNIWIGGNDIWGEYFDGVIDEPRVYKRALSAAEIQSLMEASTPTPTPGPTLTPTHTPTAIPTSTGGFPETSVLDNFNRADGLIGTNWSGWMQNYAVLSNQLHLDTDGTDADIYWNDMMFDPDQEAYVTLANLDEDGVEQDLFLKAQSSTTWGAGVLEVFFDAANDLAGVWTYSNGQGWVQHGSDIPVALADGDRIGARALSDGTVEVYRNDELLATRDVSSWPYYAEGGYIGLWFIGAEDAVLDDFGGGSIESGDGLMGRGEESGLSGEGLSLEEDLSFEAEYDPLNVVLSDAGVFWQGIPAGFEGEAVLTLTTLGQDTNKPQGNGATGEGVIEVVYDIPAGMIRLWTNDPEIGWHQIGKNIPVEFAAGDQFSVRIAEDGLLGIYQNGSLVTQRILSFLPHQEKVVDSTPQPAVYESMHVQARPVSVRNASVYHLPGQSVPALPDMLLQQSASLTIDYTYDALNRPASATYSDGRTFAYTYDAAGNVLEYEQNLGPGTVTTTYDYDAADQLLSAQQGATTTQYTYDANGSLTSDGVKTYTYDFANRLIAVESPSSTVELSYNGLGQRLSMSVAGVTTHYAMSGDYPLSATASGDTTFYLYGLGPIAEKTNAWSYSLSDGLNTPRQLTDPIGDVTFSARYTPWGDTLETYGDGGFTFGYFGSVMDAATGLLYVGNGQYYDPATGRFLTRDARPSQSNPYVPFDPTSVLFAPLGLLALFFSRRRKHGKWDSLLAILVLASAVGIGLAACGPSNPPVTNPPSPMPTLPPAAPMPTLTGPVTSNGTGAATSTEAPLLWSTPTCTVTPTPASTSTIPSDDFLRITLVPDLEHLSMQDYLKKENDAVLLARLAIGEAAEGNIATTMQEKELIMWTVRIRAEVGYSSYRAPYYTNTPSPTSINIELFAQGQYIAIQQLISSWTWAVYQDVRASRCSTNVVRMANPCDETDMQRLREAYDLAQSILSQNISQAPDSVKAYDSYWAADASTSQCSTFEQYREKLRPPSSTGASKFFDCAFVDNYWLFRDFSYQHGWLPSNTTPTP